MIGMSGYFFSYRKELLYSFGIHGVFLVMLLFNFYETHRLTVQDLTVSDPQVRPIQAPAQVIQAVAIDETVIQAEIQRLEQQDRMRLAAKKQQERKVIRQKEALAASKKAAEKAALLAKAQEKKARLEQAQLAKVRLEAQQEKKAAAKLKKEALLAQAQANALKKQALKEQAMVAKKQTEQIENEVNLFLAQIVERIEGSRQYMLHLSSDLSVDVSFFLLPDGSVKNLRIKKSSGYDIYDESALTAVRKAAPFSNMPREKTVLQRLNRTITLGFKNEHNV
jgi:colicin import membrane protein